MGSSDLIPTPLAVARSLWCRGAADAAAAILKAQLVRDPAQGEPAVLLQALLAGEEAPEEPGPDLDLDLDLAEAWLRRGWALEPLALLLGAELGEHGVGAEWAQALAELLIPPPPGAGEAIEASYRELLLGRGPEARARLDGAAGEGALPAWAERRRQILRWAFPEEAAPDEAASKASPASPASRSTSDAEVTRVVAVDLSLFDSLDVTSPGGPPNPTAQPTGMTTDLARPADRVQSLLEEGALEEALELLEQLQAMQPQRRRWAEWAESLRARVEAARLAAEAPAVASRPSAQRIKAVGGSGAEEGAVVVSRRIVKVSD